MRQAVVPPPRFTNSLRRGFAGLRRDTEATRLHGQGRGKNERKYILSSLLWPLCGQEMDVVDLERKSNGKSKKGKQRGKRKREGEGEKKRGREWEGGRSKGQGKKGRGRTRGRRGGGEGGVSIGVFLARG